MDTISNEQKVKNMTKGFLKEGLIKKSRIQELLIKAMDWKDKQYAKEKQQLIDKACQWLKSNADEWIASYSNIFIDNFKKAMEEL